MTAVALPSPTGLSETGFGEDHAGDDFAVFGRDWGAALFAHQRPALDSDLADEGRGGGEGGEEDVDVDEEDEERLLGSCPLADMEAHACFVRHSLSLAGSLARIAHQHARSQSRAAELAQKNALVSPLAESGEEWCGVLPANAHHPDAQSVLSLPLAPHSPTSPAAPFMASLAAVQRRVASLEHIHSRAGQRQAHAPHSRVVVAIPAPVTTTATPHARSCGVFLLTVSNKRKRETKFKRRKRTKRFDDGAANNDPNPDHSADDDDDVAGTAGANATLGAEGEAEAVAASPKPGRRGKAAARSHALQCMGTNRKKKSRCRNPALMEYIGPRPVYCAEHIQLDANCLYQKCPSLYQKVPGDGKKCKEVVLKEFGGCYKHFGDWLRAEFVPPAPDALQRTRRLLDRVNELIGQLGEEAEQARDADPDLYQRKTKLIPKFQAMTKVLEQHASALGLVRLQ